MKLLISAVLLGLAAPAFAWNATGHRIIAAIAYSRLTPEARARVDELLRKHPDYASLLTRDSPPDPGARSRAAFLDAAVWPDQIKEDPRFHHGSRRQTRPSPASPSRLGFRSMELHADWHYINLPFSPDGTPLEQPAAPNALTEINRILKEIKRSPDSSSKLAYDFAWLIHLVGDVHQPLHCADRFLKSQPHGDAGGNSVYITIDGAPSLSLHAFWDDLPGSDISDGYITRIAGEIAGMYMQSHRYVHVSTDPRSWVNESFLIAQRDVYNFGPETGSRGRPLALPKSYESNARRVAWAQLAAAGFRLAAVLNEKL